MAANDRPVERSVRWLRSKCRKGKTTTSTPTKSTKKNKKSVEKYYSSNNDDEERRLSPTDTQEAVENVRRAQKHSKEEYGLTTLERTYPLQPTTQRRNALSGGVGEGEGQSNGDKNSEDNAEGAQKANGSLLSRIKSISRPTGEEDSLKSTKIKTKKTANYGRSVNAHLARNSSAPSYDPWPRVAVKFNKVEWCGLTCERRWSAMSRDSDCSGTSCRGCGYNVEELWMKLCS